MTDYYQLDLDDMVIALNNRDADIELLEKKLAIAVRALVFYKNDTCAEPYVSRIASETLKKLEEVTTETIKERRIK